MQSRQIHPLLLAAFLAGTAAMIEEVVWFRLLSVIGGSDIWACSVVLAVFLAGMGLGSAFSGSRILPVRNAGRAFRGVQIFLAFYALLSPLLFRAFGHASDGLAQALPVSSHATLILMTAVLTLLGPSLAMGMTVPLLMDAAQRTTRPSSGSSGFLYGVNNAGGLAGVLLCGFFLLEHWGVWGCLFLSSLFHLGASFLGASARGRQVSPASLGRFKAQRGFALLIFGAMSFAVLGLEVAWTRALAARYLETTIYSFTCIVASAIAGLAVGGWMGGWLRRPPARKILPLWLAALIPAWSVFSWAAMPNFAGLLGKSLSWTNPGASGSLGQSLVAEMMLAALALFVPALLMGAAFALLVDEDENANTVRVSSAQLLAASSIASGLGALLIGLWAIPRFGLKGSVEAASVPIGFALLIGLWRIRGISAAASFGVCLAALSLLPFLPSVWPGAIPADSLFHRVLFRQESAGAVVEVWEDFSAQESRWGRSLLVDGHPVAGNSSLIQADQKLLAHIPLLMHPNPRRVLTVGLGTGGTSYSMRLHGAEVTCYEILPAVRRASRLFQEVHGGIFEDPNFRLSLGDARHLLRMRRERFDIIVSDVTDIHFLGNASLLSKDYFELAKSRLEEGGIFALWLLRDPGRETLRSILSTFLSVFPGATLWYPYHVNSHFTILIGHSGPVRKILWEDWKRRVRAPLIRQDLARVNSSDPLRLMMYLALDSSALSRFASGAPLHSDLHPLLDFKSARSAMRPASDLLDIISQTEPGLEAVFEKRTLPPQLFEAYRRARRELIKGYLSLSRRQWQKSLEKARLAAGENPRDAELAASGISGLLLTAHLKQAGEMLQRGSPKAAEAHLHDVLKIRPDHFVALTNLALWSMDSGRYDRAVHLFQRAKTALPQARWVDQKLVLARALRHSP